MRLALLALLLALTAPEVAVAQTADDASVSPALAQLRHVIGRWDTRTEFLGPDGSVARAVDGSYVFEWVIQDRIARGVSRIAELDQTSAILFYLRPATREIEMASVGSDGRLWVMSGSDQEEVRTTPDVPSADGGRMRLRFTRYNIEVDRFESRMDYSTDGGATWRQGNHQVFRRRGA